MNKKEILQKISFGESIAELESAKLKDYFLKTEFWKLIRDGAKDIVYGSKGSGKSAIYTSISNDVSSLFEEGTLVALAENPTGNTAFANLKNDPPTTETEFIRLWKLYFLVITANEFNEYGFKDEYANKVSKILIDCNLIPAQNKLASFLKVCFDFMRSFNNGKEISTTTEFDPVTGMYSGQKFSLSFGEPSKSDFDKGLISVEYVYELLQKSLIKNKFKLWILIDRLDVAFIESEDLETNALRALFKTYLSLAQYSEIKIKIFLRDDIWQRITSEGFREASHITKSQNLQWNKESLVNLIIRRILDNSSLVALLSLDKDEILLDIKKQEELFYRLFPKQVDFGSKKPNTIDWILSRTRDGRGVNAPRELIQLFTHARVLEIKKLENGNNELIDEQIISRQSFKDAAYDVSKQRLEQTIYAEFPNEKQYIEALRADKAEHTIETLASKWGIEKSEVNKVIKKLVAIGFFEQRGNLSTLKLKIPFMYRPYLEITQGSATSELEE